MDVIALLENQHDEVMRMLAELKQSEPGAARYETFRRLQRSLLAHMYVEEEVLYPVVFEQVSDGKPLAERYEEHTGARTFLARCAQARRTEELFRVRISVLEDLLSHYVEKERSSILLFAYDALTAAEREALGLRAEALFAKAMQAVAVGAALDRGTTRRELLALTA